MAPGDKKKTLFYNFALYFIAGVLLFSGITKIMDPLPLLETLKAFIKLPENIYILIVTILLIIEIGLGILLVLKIMPKLVLTGALLLFAAFLIFSIYGTIMGMNNDCGCFGALVESEIGWWMVIRNFILICVLLMEYYLEVYFGKKN